MVDVIGALRKYLEDHAAVGAEVSTRVYVGAIPQAESDSQPRKTVLLRYAGGPVSWRTLPDVRFRFEVWSLAPIYQDANDVDGDVWDALRAIQHTTASDGVSTVLMRSCGIGEGPTMITDPATGWPALIRSCILSADSRAVT